MRRNISAGIATSYGLDGLGSIPGSASPRRPDRLWGPPNLLYIRYRGLFPRKVKQRGRETDHSPPSSAKDMKGEVIPPLPHVSWHSA
jgi:hypothetical protein